jgi:CheY-like chemotaxis protein
VVIVEDDPLFAQALTAFVEDLGYRVLATTDTEQSAIDVVHEHQPDVVLMDVKLIGGSGLRAASMIRESSEVPIVFCTSYADDSAVRSAVRAVGNTALIGKPFDDAELADLLANAVNKRPKITQQPYATRRGWLRNGNPPGDLSKAKRCGAGTRSGQACRGPAMANGRCRMHGGSSTGPRTP